MLFSHSVVSNSVTPWTVAHQASLSPTISWSLLKPMSIESIMPSNHLILCCPLLLPSIFPSIRIFSNDLALHIRWPKYWSFSFSISPWVSVGKLLSHVQFFVTPWTVAYQAPPPMESSRQEYRSGLPFPSPMGLRGTMKKSHLIFPVLHVTLIIVLFWRVVS